MAEMFASSVEAALATETYEVFLNEDGKVRLRGVKDDQESIYKKEPEASWGRRFVAAFMRLMPVKGQL